jgi:hypothetical protein
MYFRDPHGYPLELAEVAYSNESGNGKESPRMTSRK